MAIAMLLDNPNGSQEIYEQLRERIGLDKPAGGVARPQLHDGVGGGAVSP
jgi:hypothetical protein